MPLEYEPRTRSIYSDLGFILLGFLAADRGGASLAEQFDRIAGRSDRVGLRRSERPTSPDLLTFDLATDAPTLCAAPTLPMDDDLRRGRLLIGEVHDNYAAALGGVAGHAGLFGTAPAVGTFARAVLRAARGDTTVPAPFSPALLSEFMTKNLGARQFARARLGYDAADFVVRHAHVARGLRPRRLHRHIAVDRSGARSLFRAADQSRLRRRHARRDARSAGRFTMRW